MLTDEYIILVDHYDSFTYTIKAYFETLHAKTVVIQHDDPILLDLDRLAPTSLVFSPGPGHPEEATATVAMIKKYYKKYPMLGICLGAQCMAQAFAGRVIPAHEIMHGKQSVIHHNNTGVFEHVPPLFSATRYHSLVVDMDTLPSCLAITAWTHNQDGSRVIMGLAHQNYPVFGVQYHPEAVLTEHGYLLLNNFLKASSKWRQHT